LFWLLSLTNEKHFNCILCPYPFIYLCYVQICIALILYAYFNCLWRRSVPFNLFIEFPLYIYMHIYSPTILHIISLWLRHPERGVVWQSDPAWPIYIHTPIRPYWPLPTAHAYSYALFFNCFLQAYVCVQAGTLLSHHHSLPCLTLTVTLVSHFMPYRYTCITCFVRLLPPMLFASRNVLLVSTSSLSLF